MNEYLLADVNAEPFLVILLGILFFRTLTYFFGSENVVGLSLNIEALRRQKKGLDTVKDFVRISKIDRSIILLEKEVQEAQTAAGRKKAWIGRLELFFLLFVSVLYWRIGVLRLPPSLLWPFGSLLSLPFAPQGWISASSFAFLVRSALVFLSEFALYSS